MRELIDLLFPSRCLVCGGGGDVLCQDCLPRLPRLAGAVCARCGSPAAHACRECAERSLGFASARSALVYRGEVARALAAWKEGGAWRMARRAAAIVAEVVPRPLVDVVTSVPADRDRALWRGHDPAASLARVLGREWGLPYERTLTRVTRAAAQKSLDAVERQTNLVGAFRAIRRVPRSVAVIDDVYTTGATASAAAMALREGGAARVEVVTLARVVRSQ